MISVAIGNTGSMTPAPTWIDDATDVQVNDGSDILAHLARHGALEEASALMDRLDAGTETSEIISYDDAVARLERFCADR